MFGKHNFLLGRAKDFDSLVVIITIIFIVGSLLVPSSKLFFVWSTLYFLSIFFVTRSFEKTFIYIFFPLSLFNVGQLYVFNVISPEKLNLPLYPEGRNLCFKFSPFYILNLSLFYAILVQLFKNKAFKTMSLVMLVCLIGIAGMVISATLSKYLPVLSLLYTLLFLGSWSWIIFTKTTFLFLNKEQIYRVLKTLTLVLISLLIFESLIVFAQEVRGAPLGFLIEQLDVLSYFGSGPDENSLFIRPAGLHGDSNNLAFYFLSIYSGILILWFWLKEKGQLFLSYFCIFLVTTITVLVIIFSQSRSAYLAFFVFFLVLFCLNKDLRKELKNKFKFYDVYLKLFFLFLVVIGAIILPDRSLHTIYSFTKYGGMQVRTKLNVQAIELIKRNSFFGVGLGMFIPASFDENYNGVINTFPESVHNGFLLLTAESGLLTAFCFTIFFYILFRTTCFSSNSLLMKSVFCLGTVSSFIIMFFQPFFGILTISVMFWILLIDL